MPARKSLRITESSKGSSSAKAKHFTLLEPDLESSPLAAHNVMAPPARCANAAARQTKPRLLDRAPERTRTARRTCELVTGRDRIAVTLRAFDGARPPNPLRGYWVRR